MVNSNSPKKWSLLKQHWKGKPKKSSKSPHALEPTVIPEESPIAPVASVPSQENLVDDKSNDSTISDASSPLGSIPMPPTNSKSFCEWLVTPFSTVIPDDVGKFLLEQCYVGTMEDLENLVSLDADTLHDTIGH